MMDENIDLGIGTEDEDELSAPLPTSRITPQHHVVHQALQATPPPKPTPYAHVSSYNYITTL